MSTYWHRYTVVGRYPFPVDMLRYDSAHPRESSDAFKIEEALDASTLNRVKTTHEITLITVNNNRAWKPTDGRWRSFLWSVKPDSHEVGKMT